MEANTTGWRANISYEKNAFEGKMANGVVVGYIATEASVASGVGQQTTDYKLNTWPIYYVPKYLFGGDSFKGFLKGAIGYAFTTWLDFKIALGQAEAIKNSLAEKRPQYHDFFSANFEALKSDLIGFDKSMVQIGARFQDQTLFASHPVYQYLAQSYGVEIISEHWEPGEVPSREQWDDFKKNLEQHPSTIMLWEGEPSDKVTSSLFELGVKSIVYNPCGNTPSKGDFISVMKNNINGFKSLITDQ